MQQEMYFSTGIRSAPADIFINDGILVSTIGEEPKTYRDNSGKNPEKGKGICPRSGACN